MSIDYLKPEYEKYRRHLDKECQTLFYNCALLLGDEESTRLGKLIKGNSDVKAAECLCLRIAEDPRVALYLRDGLIALKRLPREPKLTLTESGFKLEYQMPHFKELDLDE